MEYSSSQERRETPNAQANGQKSLRTYDKGADGNACRMAIPSKLPCEKMAHPPFSFRQRQKAFTPVVITDAHGMR